MITSPLKLSALYDCRIQYYIELIYKRCLAVTHAIMKVLANIILCQSDAVKVY